MRSLLLSLVAIGVRICSLAQCGGTDWTAVSDHYCVGLLQTSPTLVHLNPSTPGSPPFQITLYQGTTSTVIGTVASTMGSYAWPFLTGPFRAVITDATGCTKTVYSTVHSNTLGQAMALPTTNVLPVDPETGLGGVSVSRMSLSGMFSPSESCWSYTIRQSGNTVRNGVLDAWTIDPINVNVSRYSGLPTGSYSVLFKPLQTFGLCGYLWYDSPFDDDFTIRENLTSPWSHMRFEHHCSPSVGFTIPTAGADPNAVRLPLKVFLGGPYDQASGLMTDALRANNMLPWSFLETGYPNLASITRQNTLGPMGVAARAMTGSNALVDWVVVELRSEANPATVVYSRGALVQRDGDVVMQNGIGPLSCAVAAGNYYVAVRHRNHLAVMTAAPVALGLSTPLIDFTNPATATYGTNPQVQMGPKMVLWSGDVTGNGTLQYVGSNNDRDPQLTAVGSTTPNNTTTVGYYWPDVNMDGVVRYTGTNNDRDIILNNVGSTTPNNTRTQQLP